MIDFAINRAVSIRFMHYSDAGYGHENGTCGQPGGKQPAGYDCLKELQMRINNSMKIVSNLLLWCCLFTFSMVASGQGKQSGILPEEFHILPVPRDVEIMPGNGLHFQALDHVILEGTRERPVMGNLLSWLPFGDRTGDGALILEIVREKNTSVPDSPEGYQLIIRDQQVRVQSHGQAGLFYGCQTLQQLLEDSRQHAVPVPNCKIVDYPELSYRAVQIDVKHHLDHMKTYYDAVDRLARYKINAIIFEFEDKLRYRRQPLVGAPQAISIDEMAALTSYARERNIEITPLVQGLGHASFILKHQQYAHLREQEDNRWAFCPLHEGTYQVLFDLYRDAIEATPGSRYLHVGGDEIGSIGLCPRCKPTADEKGTLHLNVYWLNRVSEFALRHGRIPIFWDDMPLKEAGVYRTAHHVMPMEKVNRLWEKGEKKLSSVLNDFPDTCVFMRWNYSLGTQPGNIRALNYYQENDLGVMIATAAQSGPASLFPFDERHGEVSARGVPAIKSFIELAAERGIDGMLCTAWDDRSLHMETMWRGYIASAQYSWNPGSVTLDEYDELYLQKDYGTSNPDYGSLYLWLRDATMYWEGVFNRTHDRLHISNALLPLPGIGHELTPEESRRLRSKKVDYTQKLIELPDPKNPGVWTRKYSDRLEEAERLMMEYPGIAEQLNELYQTSRYNRYHWEVFQALNDFQITAPRLMLALKTCDVKGAGARKRGNKEVEKALKEFDSAWEHLKEVYAKTRFLSYPPDYVPDRYYHFASQREDIAFMIQVEELFHEMVRDWMASK